MRYEDYRSNAATLLNEIWGKDVTVERLASALHTAYEHGWAQAWREYLKAPPMQEVPKPPTFAEAIAASPNEGIGKIVLKRPQSKEGVKKLLDGLIDGHRYPPIRVLVEWDDRWTGKE